MSRLILILLAVFLAFLLFGWVISVLKFLVWVGIIGLLVALVMGWLGRGARHR